MTPRTRSHPQRAPRTRRSRRQEEEDEDIPEVYREMLAEADAREAREAREFGSPRPIKKRKVAGQLPPVSHAASVGDQEVQDVVEVEEEAGRPPQTVYNSPSGSSDESDMEWEEVEIQLAPSHAAQTMPFSGAGNDESLQITLGQHEDRKQKIMRRKPVTAAEKKMRLDVHKTHILCLMSHVQQRNLWCNDENVQKFLKQMLSKNIISLLNPSESKAQYARSAAFIDGLNQACEVFIRRFRVTEPGLKRAHWANDSSSLKQKTESIMTEAEMIESKDEFRTKAMTMRGSRDFGAQLFCALLRSVAIEARLVCSLQPLPFSGTTKDITSAKLKPQPIVISSDSHETLTDEARSPLSSPQPSRIRRIAQPQFNTTRTRNTASTKPPPVARESSYPVYWVEAFNEAIQKWIVIDPLVTKSLAKPYKLEPPSADPYNTLSYVVAFEDDASARDVTRRYTKAFNAKTRKLRVESSKNGEAWWNRVLRFFEKPFMEDRDELETGELTARTAAEPMPRNVQDFKDHPIYALERHLHRNEVIHPKRTIGQVSLGKSGIKGQTSEPVYRRSDVQTLRSANKWYRLGRDIKMGEQALKHIPPSKNKAVNLGDDEDGETALDTPLYAFFQTELYQPPPVVQGKVPKNVYGNLDVYVPSMVPPGGVHIAHREAVQAARILGIDYAAAVTGFSFKGRHGTAVFQGVVIANEYEEALQEILRGLEDERHQNELEQKSAEVLRLWRHFLLKLRIAERVKGYAFEGEEADDETNPGPHDQNDTDVEETGGGFIPDETAISNIQTHTSNRGISWDQSNQDIPFSGPRMELGGGFLPEEDEMTLPPLQDQVRVGSRAPPRGRPKYSLIVIPNSEAKNDIPASTSPAAQQAGIHAGAGAPGGTPGIALESSSESPIALKPSTELEEPINIESDPKDTMQMTAPTPSPEAQSIHSESHDEGSLLSEDPEDEDAVPDWLMSD